MDELTKAIMEAPPKKLAPLMLDAAAIAAGMNYSADEDGHCERQGLADEERAAGLRP